VSDGRSVVITGASRGLGLASAAHLHRQGWTVVCAVRSPDAALERLRAATGGGDGDPRLVAVRIDLDDPASIVLAARAIGEAVGAPDALVHNAGVAAVGCVEEMPASVLAQIFSTNFFGPVRLTQELLPGMRAAGRGRIVVVSSEGGARGMPTISAYSAAKGALERWAEALSPEVAPFGIGVTVLVAGSFKTDILELTQTYADPDGPYAAHHAGLDRIERWVRRAARPPERFAPALARAVEDRAPFARRAVGPDAHLMLLGSRLLPARMFQRVAGLVMGLPKPGALRGDPARLATVAPWSEASDASDASDAFEASEEREARG
jgi:NAD(P)-dependent dehydrogenase (short-subunit alcohol dehydrogenase family)